MAKIYNFTILLCNLRYVIFRHSNIIEIRSTSVYEYFKALLHLTQTQMSSLNIYKPALLI